MPKQTSRIVGSFEAKTHLSRLLAEVEAGAEITVTRRGHPIARIVPAAGSRATAAPQRSVDAWLAYSKRRKLTTGGLSIREMIDEGRRR
ncbi:MAG: type II toxin-antitoxin system Phd/YefM family antitoxin [Vulcanimicrobiaceae bacterium]